MSIFSPDPRIHPEYADPCPASRAITLTKQSAIPIIMTNIEHSLCTSVFEGAQEIHKDKNMQLIGTNAYSDSERQTSLLKFLRSLGVYIVIDCSSDLECAASVKLPIVLVDHVELSSTTETAASWRTPRCRANVDQIFAGSRLPTHCLRFSPTPSETSPYVTAA